MQDQLVSFETAKLAKFKGFYKTTGWMGFVDKFYHPRTKTLLSMGRTGRTPFDTLIYAPTQSLLQRWFREVHKIHIDTIYNSFTGEYSIVVKTTLKYNVKSKVINGFTDYESALESGLKFAPKLIK